MRCSTSEYISFVALDPELLAYLGGPDDANMDDIEGSRAVADALTAQALASPRPLAPGVSFVDDVATDESGSTVPVRIYRHVDNGPSAGVLLFIHGGAFVFGGLESEHDRCLEYATTSHCVIVSVDYRLAPEFPYPAGLDDVALVLNWLRRNARALGIDSGRICVGGASAGGSLAAGLVLRNRDQGGPAIAAQMLIYPVLDDRGTTNSMSAYEVYDPWDGQRSRKMWPLYLGHSGEAPPYAAAARAQDLRGLPTTYLMSCEEDPLRDEELEFAQRLLHAGISVELHHYRGTYHAFDVIAPDTALARRALEEQSEFLRSVVGDPVSERNSGALPNI